MTSGNGTAKTDRATKAATARATRAGCPSARPPTPTTAWATIASTAGATAARMAVTTVVSPAPTYRAESPRVRRRGRLRGRSVRPATGRGRRDHGGAAVSRRCSRGRGDRTRRPACRTAPIGESAPPTSQRESANPTRVKQSPPRPMRLGLQRSRTPVRLSGHQARTQPQTTRHFVWPMSGPPVMPPSRCP
jgi:hypothetical protein